MSPIDPEAEADGPLNEENVHRERPNGQPGSEAPPSSGDPVVPKRLMDSLRSFGGGADGPSPSVDDAVLEQARARFESQETAGQTNATTLPVRFGRPSVVAAAAAVCIGIGLGLTFDWARGRLTAHPDAPSTRTTARADDLRHDFDRNGRVDVRDALGLANAVRDQIPLEAQWDLNRDGSVDTRDVDAMLAEVTRL